MFIFVPNEKKINVMKNTMKLAIETYAKLNNITFDKVVSDCNNGNEVVVQSIIKLMFSVA